MKSILCLLISYCLSAICFGQENPPKILDYGEIKGDMYHNDFFNLDIIFDTAWVAHCKGQGNSEEETAPGSNKKPAGIKADNVTSVNIFWLSRYEYGTDVKFNPSFTVTAVNLAKKPAVKTSADYLLSTKKLLDSTTPNAEFIKPVYGIRISSRSADVLEVKMRYAGLEVNQHYIVTIVNGFALAFNLSYTDDAAKRELYSVIEQLRIQ